MSSPMSYMASSTFWNRTRTSARERRGRGNLQRRASTSSAPRATAHRVGGASRRDAVRQGPRGGRVPRGRLRQRVRHLLHLFLGHARHFLLRRPALFQHLLWSRGRRRAVRARGGSARVRTSVRACSPGVRSDINFCAVFIIWGLSFIIFMLTSTGRSQSAMACLRMFAHAARHLDAHLRCTHWCRGPCPCLSAAPSARRACFPLPQ